MVCLSREEIRSAGWKEWPERDSLRKEGCVTGQQPPQAAGKSTLPLCSESHRPPSRLSCTARPRYSVSLSQPQPLCGQTSGTRNGLRLSSSNSTLIMKKQAPRHAEETREQSAPPMAWVSTSRKSSPGNALVRSQDDRTLTPRPAGCSHEAPTDGEYREVGGQEDPPVLRIGSLVGGEGARVAPQGPATVAPEERQSERGMSSTPAEHTA